MLENSDMPTINELPKVLMGLMQESIKDGYAKKLITDHGEAGKSTLSAIPDHNYKKYDFDIEWKHSKSGIYFTSRSIHNGVKTNLYHGTTFQKMQKWSALMEKSGVLIVPNFDFLVEKAIDDSIGGDSAKIYHYHGKGIVTNITFHSPDDVTWEVEMGHITVFRLMIHFDYAIVYRA